MSPEHQRSNLESWDAVAADIEQYPDNAHWTPWKVLAQRFLRDGRTAGLDRYFRAGQSMHHIIFSTLAHHRLQGEPCVTVMFHPESDLRIAYGAANLPSRTPDQDYSLPYDEGIATFRRFLHQLWSATVPDPIPEDIRSPHAPLLAPVLPHATNVASAPQR